jgi:hypothetical protein
VKLTIYYDDQFWVGVFEEVCDAKSRACRYVFGPEQENIEILELVNRKMLSLIAKSSQFVSTEESMASRVKF